MSAVVTPSVTASWPCYVMGQPDAVTAPARICGWIRAKQPVNYVFVTLLRGFLRNTPIFRELDQLSLYRLPAGAFILDGVLRRKSRNGVTHKEELP